MTRQPEVAAGRRSSRPNRFDVVLVVALALSVFFQRLDYVLWLEGISDTGRHLRGRRRDPVRTRRVSPSEGLASTHPTEPEGDHAAGISAHRDRDVGGGSCSRRSQGNIAAAAREPDAGRPHHRPGRLPQECHCLFRRHQRNATRTTAAAGSQPGHLQHLERHPLRSCPGQAVYLLRLRQGREGNTDSQIVSHPARGRSCRRRRRPGRAHLEDALGAGESDRDNRASASHDQPGHRERSVADAWLAFAPGLPVGGCCPPRPFSFQP